MTSFYIYSWNEQKKLVARGSFLKQETRLDPLKQVSVLQADDNAIMDTTNWQQIEMKLTLNSNNYYALDAQLFLSLNGFHTTYNISGLNFNKMGEKPKGIQMFKFITRMRRGINDDREVTRIHEQSAIFRNFFISII